jgi:SOS-response transcriptional repressor LexA
MISPRQQRVLIFIKGYIQANHNSPTFKEICERFGYRSPSTVARIIDILEDQELITRIAPRIARGLKVV